MKKENHKVNKVKKQSYIDEKIFEYKKKGFEVKYSWFHGFELFKYNGNSSIVEIPNGIEYISCRAFDIDKTYPIGISPLLIQNDSERNYFQANPNIGIKKIIFPDSVKEFEVGAVSNLPNLEEVVLPRGITELPKLVLTNCPKLKKITTFTKKITISHSNLENNPECLDKEIIYHGIRLKINLSKYKYKDYSNKD